MPSKGREVPRPFELHWGKGQIVEEASTVGPYHEPAIQLLEFEDGTLSLRFCYYDHQGRFQRSPLMMSSALLPELKASVQRCPRIQKLLKELLT